VEISAIIMFTDNTQTDITGDAKMGLWIYRLPEEKEEITDRVVYFCFVTCH